MILHNKYQGSWAKYGLVPGVSYFIKDDYRAKAMCLFVKELYISPSKLIFK